MSKSKQKIMEHILDATLQGRVYQYIISARARDYMDNSISFLMWTLNFYNWDTIIYWET